MAAVIAVALSPSITFAAPIAAKTHTFLSSAFSASGSNFLAIEGTPQWELSLEALMQQRATGVKFAQQIKPAKYLLGSTAIAVGASTNPNSGYLYDANRQLLPARAGLFLAASHSLRAPNNPLRKVVLTRLKSSIATDGTLNQAPNGAVDYAWVIFGLRSQNQTELADKVALKLLSLANADGGFDGSTDESSVTATGLSMQALAAVRNSGGAVAEKAKLSALRNAYRYLVETDALDSHWVSAGAPTSIATAYALMGIKAFAGSKAAAPYQKWLSSQLTNDGGIRSTSSANIGDLAATAVGLLPISGKTYLDAIR